MNIPTEAWTALLTIAAAIAAWLGKSKYDRRKNAVISYIDGDQKIMEHLDAIKVQMAKMFAEKIAMAKKNTELEIVIAMASARCARCIDEVYEELNAKNVQDSKK